MKMKFAVIGHPVAHSLSPKMHQANFKAIGFDGTYEKFDVAPEDVEAFVRAKQREGYAGLNVTVPHKLAVATARATRSSSRPTARSPATIRT